MSYVCLEPSAPVGRADIDAVLSIRDGNDRPKWSIPWAACQNPRARTLFERAWLCALDAHLVGCELAHGYAHLAGCELGRSDHVVNRAMCDGMCVRLNELRTTMRSLRREMGRGSRASGGAVMFTPASFPSAPIMEISRTRTRTALLADARRAWAEFFDHLTWVEPPVTE